MPDITVFLYTAGTVRPAHDGMNNQAGGMYLQVKVPGNFCGGYGAFFPENPQGNLVFQAGFFFRGQWSGTDD
ncbi:hypothetical protein DQD18_15165 [Salmonella enterica subsp. enterica serovar Oranienburg]|nr:hypothetical protein [Salmonella enterica subsp. enterica serovar Oranienburg]EBV1656075.1 hypothetical protein [Salmonella enterica subsp. enterica serovar Oranienburg]EBW7315186.1 hypothetical protein [Salmonella enterica subsp. enterica serovar Oranienburg]